MNPPFPYDFGDENSHFWAWHFDIIEQENIRFLVINSSAFHGVSKEYMHGRISDTTLSKINTKLKNASTKKINIVLCHHHIHKNEDIKIGEYDSMHGGERLLNDIDKINCGPWMVIHGHKHHPKIYYGNSTTGQSMPIFSAGSFSGDINGMSSYVQNQFYTIDFSLNDIETFGLVGTFKAWDFVVGRGWNPASTRSGLPDSGGFGFPIMKNFIHSEFNKILSDHIEYDEITALFPWIKYITPGGVEHIVNICNEKNIFEVHTYSGKIKIHI